MIRLHDDIAHASAHFFAIEGHLRHVIIDVIKNNGISATKKRAVKTLENDLLLYLTVLLNGENLDTLITTSAAELPTLIKTVHTAVPTLLDARKTSSEILYYLFVDRNYFTPFDKWKFIERIKVDTCVYCNRNYIYYLNKSQQVKPQLDHFYPKSKYPFLAMSYYNLIPSCQTCNGLECKGENDPLDKDSLLINPYLVEHNEFRFDFTILSADHLNGIKGHAYSVEIISHPKKHVEVFKLSELYGKHSDHIAELVLKASMNYNSRYRNYLKNEYRGLGLTDHDINRMLTGNYTEEGDFHKRPFSKMYFDIANDLGLIDF